MFHFVFKILGITILALSVVFAVLDITRSITASEIVLTPLGGTWAGVSPQSLAEAEQIVFSWGITWLWDPILVSVLKIPSWLFLLIVAMIFLKLGQQRKNPYGRFASR